MPFLSTSTKYISAGGSAGTGSDLPIHTCGLRLTLTSGTPVTTADVTGATTIYATPYISNQVYLYTQPTSGTTSVWTAYNTAELSLALGTLSSATKPYDVFIQDNAGTLQLTKSNAWTSATARSQALAQQNGVWVLGSDTSQRYLGTFYPTATTTTEDSGISGTAVANRFLWNMYNRVPRAMQFHLTTNYTYTTNTYRQAGANASAGLFMVRGFDLDGVIAHVQTFPSTTNATGVSVPVGVGLDSTTVTSANSFGQYNFPNATQTTGTSSAVYSGFPGLGYHALNWIEKSTASGSTTWNTDATTAQAGISGWVMA